jgi:hypothetical protein
MKSNSKIQAALEDAARRKANRGRNRIIMLSVAIILVTAAWIGYAL